MSKEEISYCSICGRPYTGYGNNAKPVNDGRCCDYCNDMIVTPRRIYDATRKLRENKER